MIKADHNLSGQVSVSSFKGTGTRQDDLSCCLPITPISLCFSQTSSGMPASTCSKSSPGTSKHTSCGLFNELAGCIFQASFLIYGLFLNIVFSPNNLPPRVGSTSFASQQDQIRIQNTS